MTGNALIRRLAGGAAIASLIKIGGVGVSFLFLLVMARSMSAEAFGVFAAGLSLALIAGPTATVGQHTAVLRFWPSFDEALGRKAAAHATRRAFAIALAGAAVILTIGLALFGFGVRLKAFGDEPAAWLMIAMLAAAIAVSEVIVAALRAQGDLLWALAPKDILWRGGVMSVVLVLGLSLEAVNALALVSAMLAIITIVQAMRLTVLQPELAALRRLPDVLPADERARMAHAQWGFWGNAIVGPVQQQSATAIIAIVLGPREAGIFFAANRLASLLSIILLAANQVAGPMLSRSWHSARKHEVQAIATLTAAVAFGSSMIGYGFFIVFGRWALGLFGNEFASAYYVLLILSIGQVANAACGPNGTILQMVGLERRFFGILALNAALSIPLYVFAGYVGGPIAVALVVAGLTFLWNLSASYVVVFELGIVYSANSLLRLVGLKNG